MLMKKSALFFGATLVLAATLGLPACSRDATSAGGERRAASPEAAEFNRETSENSRTPEQARDSAAKASKRLRGSQLAPQ